MVAWRHLADFAGKYLDKGRMIVVEGRWQMRDYTDREGKKRRAWDVLAESIYFADSKREPNAANFEAGFNASAQPVETPTSEGFMAIEEDSNLPF